MRRLMYRNAHSFLILLDIVALVLAFPWEYSDSQKRKMKEKINA
jgi:hypothetical protein